jgi:hypothetical protein
MDNVQKINYLTGYYSFIMSEYSKWTYKFSNRIICSFLPQVQ